MCDARLSLQNGILVVSLKTRFCSFLLPLGLSSSWLCLLPFLSLSLFLSLWRNRCASIVSFGHIKFSCNSCHMKLAAVTKVSTQFPEELHSKKSSKDLQASNHSKMLVSAMIPQWQKSHKKRLFWNITLGIQLIPTQLDLEANKEKDTSCCGKQKVHTKRMPPPAIFRREWVSMTIMCM